MIDPLSRLIHRHAGKHGPVILMYHAISHGSGPSDWPWGITIQQFRNQLDFLVDQGYATPTMGQLVAAPHHWAGRTAVITFDDGYVDNLAACDALLKRGMHASWFIVAGSIGREPVWSADGRPDGRLLNAAELREMQAAGMEIGSHTVNHVRLTEVDDQSLHRELADSKSGLEDQLGSAVTSLAYPYGAWDGRCIVAAKQAGYAAACTTRTGWAMRDNDPHRLRRLTITNTDTASSLARKLHFASNDVSWKTLFHHYVHQTQSRLGSHVP